MKKLDRDEMLIKNALENVCTPDFDIVEGVEERMKMKPIKGIARKGILMGFLAACFMVVTVAAATYVNTGSDFLRTFFAGDTAYLEEHVQTSGEYVTDGRYVLTLEQSLATIHQALVIFSVEALTNDAIAELNAQCENGFYTFIGMDTTSFGPVSRLSPFHANCTVQFGGWSQREITERRTETKRYFAIAVDSMVNEEGVDFFIRLNKMTNPQEIIIPMSTSIDTHEFTLNCATGEAAILRFTPLGLTLERTVSSEGDLFANIISGLHFRMLNGEVYTFSQLLRINSVGQIDFGSYDREYDRRKLTATFREITSMSEFASIILDNVEHNIHTGQTSLFARHAAIEQFVMQPYIYGHMWIPLEELSQNIGADFRWDSNINTATIVYRNSTFVLEVNSTIILINGMVYDLQHDEDMTFMSEDGRVIASSRLFDLMGIGVVAINQFDDNWNVRPVSEWQWIVMP